MIFRTGLSAQPSQGEMRPVFEAVFEVQQRAAAADWYVAQPDHARISGQFAAAFDGRKVPRLGPELLRAIAMHDIGWMPFDGNLQAPQKPELRENGQPASFVHAAPEQFLAAWSGSIQAAQSTGPLGGLMVAAHLARLCHPYLNSGAGTTEQRAKVEGFLYREAQRVDRQLPQAGRSTEEINELIKVLQFCDLVSLYLCANPQSPVELPQEFDGSRVQFSFEQGAYRMRPNLMDHVVILEIPCLRWIGDKVEKELIPIKVQ
jgi:hypothetical protein